MNESSNSALMKELQQFQAEAGALLVYRDILAHQPSQIFIELLSALSRPDTDAAEMLTLYGEWFYAIAASGWQAWVEGQILSADNPFTQRLQHQGLADSAWAIAARHDLGVLQRWVAEGPRLIQDALQATLPSTIGLTLPKIFCPTEGRINKLLHTVTFDFSGFESWPEALPALSNHYCQNGVGLFSQYLALRWRDQALEGIDHPDWIAMEELVGYPEQQRALRQNTEALLSGHPALNVLLYGSRGSGKSALVKALLPAYCDRGLRLIELSKADMVYLPRIVELLRTSALKFAIFVDDLSFEEDEESYKALKVVLEGTLTAKPQNVVVYATSNRRHLIREFFGDRPRLGDADEVHTWDTVQEKLSLSDRFGLALTFEPASQDTYLDIVRGYAQRFAIEISDEDLTYQALQWAVRHNVRSGRTARQFIDHLSAQLAMGEG
jgi:uncharacterized protein